MECLRGHIGLLGCDSDTPPSGRYVNSLPGISLKAVDNTASSEQVTYTAVWSAIQDRAIAAMNTAVTSKLAERFRLKQILESIDLGQQVNTDEVTVASAQYRGFVYELTTNGQSTRPSALQTVYIQQLRVYLTDTGDFTVKVFDLDRKIQLYTKTVTGGTAGWNTVNVYESFSATRLFVAFNATAYDTVEQKLSDYAADCCNACAGRIYGYGCTGMLRGATATTADPYTVTKADNHHGISAVFSLLCSFENVVCKNLRAFETAYWYKLGEEIMVEKIGSERFNLTTINKSQAEELMKLYGGRFDTEIANVCSGIDLDQNDCCIECNAALMRVENRM